MNDFSGLPTHRSDVAPAYTDEIDLFELLQDLIRQKWVVVSAVVVSVLCALAYLFVVTPMYETESRIQLVSQGALAVLSVPGVDYSLTPDEAMLRVQQSLASWRVRASFFQANKALFQPVLNQELTPEQSFDDFDSQAFLLHPAQTEGKNLSLDDRATYIKLTYPATLDGVAITNGLMNYAVAHTRAAVIRDFQASLNQQLADLRHQIKTERAAYEGHLRGRVAQVEGALKVADKLGIKTPSVPAGLSGVVVSNNFSIEPLAQDAVSPQAGQKQGLSLPQNNSSSAKQQVPLYFLGSHTLSAELALLTSRLGLKVDTVTNGKDGQTFQDRALDPFIVGLYALKQQGRYLSSVQPDFAKLKLVSVTREATASSQPVKPKKLLVLALVIVLGLMLGVLLALLRAAWKKRNVDAMTA